MLLEPTPVASHCKCSASLQPHPNFQALASVMPSITHLRRNHIAMHDKQNSKAFFCEVEHQGVTVQNAR